MIAPELKEAFEFNKAKWEAAIKVAESREDTEMARMGKAILYVIGVLHGWLEEDTVLGLLSVQKASAEILLAIERGMGGH